jgi:hypothetical protein
MGHDEENDDIIVMICNEKEQFKGTGFLYSDKYVVTCHHCIYDCDKIFVKYKDEKYEAEWIADFSKPEEDIAALKVDIQVTKPVKDMMETPAGVEISILAYSYNDIENLYRGFTISAKLPNRTDPLKFSGLELKNRGTGKNKSWNIKPSVTTRVYSIEGAFEKGYSGSPVFYTVNNKLIGMFIALKGEKYGFILPIENIYKCFKVITTKESSETVATVKTNEIHLFISKPSRLNPKQEIIWDRLHIMLLDNNIPIKFLDPDDYPEFNAITKVKLTLDDCDGVIVLGLKQIYIEKGTHRKDTVKPEPLENYDLPTPWNNLEGGMAFMKGIPIFIISEKDLKGGGIFDVKNKDKITYYFSIETENWWESSEFILTLNKWFRDASAFRAKKNNNK